VCWIVYRRTTGHHTHTCTRWAGPRVLSFLLNQREKSRGAKDVWKCRPIHPSARPSARPSTRKRRRSSSSIATRTKQAKKRSACASHVVVVVVLFLIEVSPGEIIYQLLRDGVSDGPPLRNQHLSLSLSVLSCQYNYRCFSRATCRLLKVLACLVVQTNFVSPGRSTAWRDGRQDKFELRHCAHGHHACHIAPQMSKKRTLNELSKFRKLTGLCVSAPHCFWWLHPRHGSIALGYA
jgi:hypothetical protein